MVAKKKSSKTKKKSTKVSKNTASKTSRVQLKSEEKLGKKSAKKDKGKKNKNIAAYISLGIIGVVVLAYGSFYGYKLYEKNNLDNYNRAVYEIQVGTSKKMSNLNPLFQEFVAAPNVAKKLGPKFKQASDITRRAALGLETIEPPNDYKSTHNALIKTYKDGSALYKDLYELSNYIIERDKVLKSLIKELKNFSKKISETKKKSEAIVIAGGAEKKIKKTLGDVKVLESPISLYDEDLLVKYTKALAKHLKEFQEALTKKSRNKIELALYNIQVDYAQSWQEAFFKTDKKAVEKYDEQVKQIETLYKEATN